MSDHDARITAYQEQIAVMTRIMEAFPDKHMRFGYIDKDGTFVKPTRCADWCYACKLEKLERRNKYLTERTGNYFRLLRLTQGQLRQSRAEAAGRKAYGDTLKTKIIEQHIELCELAEKHAALKRQVDAAYQLINQHTPYGRHVPLPNVINWLITAMNSYREQAESDGLKLRELRDERRRAWGLLFDAKIYTDTIDQGIKELLARKTD